MFPSTPHVRASDLGHYAIPVNMLAIPVDIFVNAIMQQKYVC